MARRIRPPGIEIVFRHTVEGQEEHYKLERSWKRAGGGCKEHFEVLKNGAPEPALADNWATKVEEFFPANIAYLFLFDGEQIEAYASQQDSSALIGAAIQNLLGLDMVDQFEKDLLVYERRKRAENKDDARHAEITASQDAVRNLRRRVEDLKQERAALRTHRIDKQQRALRAIEDQYRKLGGALYDQRQDIELSWAEARQAQARVEHENVPSADTIAEIAAQRESVRKEIAEAEALDAAMGQDIERQERELERREQALGRLIEADTKEKSLRDDRTRILHHAGKVRGTLGTLRRAVIERHVRRIEQLVLESYQQLLRKAALVTRLSISPDDYSLTLYGSDDQPLSAERLSAGERHSFLQSLSCGGWRRHRGGPFADRDRHAPGPPGLRAPYASCRAVPAVCEPPDSFAIHRRGNRRGQS